MCEYTFAIIMDTQLGQRHGTMLLNINVRQIRGSMRILENEEPGKGELLENGICRLRGQIVTLMQTMEYTAEGYLNSEKIDLTLHGEQNDFYISGLTVKPEEWRQVE